MKSYFCELKISTKHEVELIDITREVERCVGESNIKSGICLVYSPHATAAVIVNENEQGLVEDIKRKVSEAFPKGLGYLHDRIDSNAHAHLASAFLGTCRVFPVMDGRLARGTWQNVFLVELDGPRPGRKVVIGIVGE